MIKILFLNGPNLNLLGKREPHIYGSVTLADINNCLQGKGKELNVNIECRQSNYEGQLIDWVQEASGEADAIVLNAGGYTHTSVALRDAVAASSLPVIEIHLSNIFSREEFRHFSFLSPAVEGVICGFGANGYLLALDAAVNLVNIRRDERRGEGL